jgi:hypothetical protein
MAIPSYTVYGNRPRLLFRDTDKTALTARTNSASSWKTFWDDEVIPEANTRSNQSVSQLVSSGWNVELMMMLLAFPGWIENNSAYTDKAIEFGLHIASRADNQNPTNKRERLLALTYCFDVCFGSMTTSERNTMSSELLQQCDRMGTDDQYFDGHAGIDQTIQVMAALTGHGYGSYNWSSRLNEGLGYWYGISSQQGRDEIVKYGYADGGAEKSGSYFWRGLSGELLLAESLTNGTTNVRPYTEFADFYSRIWEWALWIHLRGDVDVDHESEGDTAKLTGPLFPSDNRPPMGILSERFPTPNGSQGGLHLRWMWNKYDALEGAFPVRQVFDVFSFDRAANLEVAPESATVPISRSRLFNPPGVYRYRSTWDYDTSAVYRISLKNFYFLGHSHLDAGSVMIRYRGDPLILSPAGVYDSFSGSHHINCYQRSWMQSGCPLIMDNAQTYKRFPTVVLNDGGQHYKKFGPTDNISEPLTAFDMLNDGGGETWRRCRASIIRDDTKVMFASADLRPGYRKRSFDTDRASVLEVKYLLIHPSAGNGLTETVLLYYARIKKNISSSTPVYIPWHARGDWSSVSGGAEATGYRTEIGTGAAGKIHFQVYNDGQFNLNIQTYGTPDGNGYSNDQFRHPDNIRRGVSSPAAGDFRPAGAESARHQATLKRSSLAIEKKTKTSQEDYVFLLCPTAAAAALPTFTWLTETDYYGVDIGGEEFKVHKTADIVIADPGEVEDTTPPAEVTGHSLSTRSQSLRANYTDPVDADLNHIEAWYRTAAT